MGSGVSVIRYRINDSDWIDYIGAFTLSSYNVGYYNISYQAIDAAGNVEEINTILVKLVEIDTFNEELLLIILIIGSSAGAILSIVIVLSVFRKPKKEQIISEIPREVVPQELMPQEAQKTDIAPSICPNCGSKLTVRDKFCKYCGFEL